MNGTLLFRYETRRMVLGLILQYAMFYNAKCAFLFFFSWNWWFGGCTIGYFVFANMLFSVQWLTDLSRNFVFVLFTFFKYVLRYRVCLIFFNCLFCFLFFQLVLLFPLGWFCGSLLLFVVEVVAFSPLDLRGVVACMYLGVGCLYVGCRDVCGHFFWRSNDFLVDPVVGNSIVDDLRRALH